MTHFRFSDRVCCVCARPAVGWGYAKGARTIEQIGWCCDDTECLEIARDSYEMRQTEFNRIDAMATEDGGQKAGAYLEGIGKTDLATMTADEWERFCREMVAGYREALKGRLRGESPF